MAEVTDHAGDTMAELPLTQKGLKRGKKIPTLITAGWAEGKESCRCVCTKTDQINSSGSNIKYN